MRTTERKWSKTNQMVCVLIAFLEMHMPKRCRFCQLDILDYNTSTWISFHTLHHFHRNLFAHQFNQILNSTLAVPLCITISNRHMHINEKKVVKIPKTLPTPTPSSSPSYALPLYPKCSAFVSVSEMCGCIICEQWNLQLKLC